MNLLDLFEQYQGINENLLERNFLCGVEYEIEDIKSEFKHRPNVTVEVDHSLRNGGLEFKTGPHSFERALDLFDEVHDNLNLGPKAYTDRTSIHVHVNMLGLDLEEIKQFVLCYALFEPLFFEFVGPVRKGSIFCVPLNYTYLPSIYSKPVPVLCRQWHKYTAFNLCSLEGTQEGSKPLGTIEFRHLYGTGDKQIFETWLTAIKELYTFIESTSDYNILDDIIRDFSPKDILLKAIPTFHTLYASSVNQLCKDSLLDVKLSSGGLK